MMAVSTSPAPVGFPAYLVLGVVQAAAIVWLYRLVLHWEGDLLQQRERQILEVVATRAD